MDPNLHQHFEVNTLNFKRSLDRIAEKYSKLKDDDDVPDVDISIISTKSLSSQLTKSRRRIMKLGLMSQSDIEDQTLSSHVSDHSQLTWQSKEDDSSASSGECSKDYSAEKTQESLDESGRELSESELLPEDQDEALQMSLSSQSGSLAELYPMMVSRIQRAWNRQTVSVGASSVLRRYRRWRQQPRGNLNKTFNITASAEHPEPLTGKRPLQEGSGSPGRRMWPQMTVHPAPSTVAVLHDGEHQSPGRERGLLSGQTPRLISAPDLSGAAKPKERSFIETFFGCELSPRKQTQIGEQGAASPSRRPYAAAKWCVDPPLRFKRHSVSSHSAEASTCAAETASGPQSSRIYSSPVRQSPLKAREVSALCRSPLVFTVSPREPDWESSREPTYPRSLPVVVSSPPKRPVGLLKMMLHPQDSSQPPRPLPLSPLQARAADNHRRPRRNLSFDSSSSRPVSLSPNKVDEDFEKLYHKFVCQSKPVDFSGLPSPRGRSSEARRVLLSTSLSALALSPHRSILRKRHCEDRCDGCPQPKLFRNENYPYSPGSTRHMREMLKRSHSQSELEPSHSVGPCSPRRLRTMGALLSRHRLQFSSSGGAPENEAVYVYPPW